jgi:hypothetical protein
LIEFKTVPSVTRNGPTLWVSGLQPVKITHFVQSLLEETPNRSTQRFPVFAFFLLHEPHSDEVIDLRCA